MVFLMLLEKHRWGPKPMMKEGTSSVASKAANSYLVILDYQVLTFLQGLKPLQPSRMKSTYNLGLISNEG